MREKGTATSAQISMAKRNNVDMAINIAREARQMLGGMGITGEYSIMRHSMNLESVITYEGTHDIHLLITGLDITGENAFNGEIVLISRCLVLFCININAIEGIYSATVGIQNSSGTVATQVDNYTGDYFEDELSFKFVDHINQEAG